jgi:3-oxoacyl-[acyl-carrier protein] reductase
MNENAVAEAIRGRVVLVTGSGRGLGAGLVRAAAQCGARVVINYRADAHAAESLARDVLAAGGQALPLRADVTDYAQAVVLVEQAVRAFGRIDVLVNAVGAFVWHPVAELEPHEWRRLMASNLDSVYHMCRQVIPHMRRHHWGRILNLGAVGAERAHGEPRTSAYSAAKAAVIAFSKALALEEARHGITVNVLSPGVTLADGRTEGNGDRMGERVPVGRAGGPEDVARAMLFFASPSAGFVTGQVLAVAGGWHL